MHDALRGRGTGVGNLEMAKDLYAGETLIPDSAGAHARSPLQSPELVSDEVREKVG